MTNRETNPTIEEFVGRLKLSSVNAAQPFDCCGRGDANGNGCGSGNGDGIEAFDGHRVYYFDGHLLIIDSVDGDCATARVLESDLTTHRYYIAIVGTEAATGSTANVAMSRAKINYERTFPLSERLQRFSQTHDKSQQYTVADYIEWVCILGDNCWGGCVRHCSTLGIDNVDDEYPMDRAMEVIRLYGDESLTKIMEKAFSMTN